MEKIQYKSIMEPIPIEKFLNNTGLNLGQIDFGQWDKISRIVAPRDIKKVIAVNIMSTEYLRTLLSVITLLGDPNKKVYANTQIKLIDMDPKLLYVGQKYVYRDHYTAIMEDVCQLFKNFTVPQGVSQWTPYLIIGTDANNDYVLAHYLPPIIEKHSNKFILLDGIHRCFIARQSGTNITSIIVEGVTVQFPCTPRHFNEVEILAKKPEVEVEKRHFNLKRELFRNLRGAAGIDG